MIAFGSDAISDLSALYELQVPEWCPESDSAIIELGYVDRADLLHKLKSALMHAADKVLVIRDGIQQNEQSFEDVLRPFVGHAPMECQSEPTIIQAHVVLR